MAHEIIFDELDEEVKLGEEEEVVEPKDGLDDVPENPPKEDDKPITEEEDDLPEKFKGKSSKEVYESYKELEKKLGQQSQEIGELRKFTDTYLHQELDRAAPDKKQEEKIEFDDFLTDPTDAARRAVKTDIEKINSRLEANDRKAAIREFEGKHPDYLDVVKDKEFAEWVKSSPYRYRQLQAADKFDMYAADDLLSSWKERRDIVKAKQETVKKEKRDTELKQVTSESGSSGERPRKVFRRADLIRLRQNDPDRFDAMYDEIAAAYAEGRVR